MQKQQNQSHDPEVELRKAILDLPVSDRIKAVALAHYRKQWLSAEEDLNTKIDQLKKQHFLNIMPLQKKSNEIVVGARLPSAQELENLDEYLNEEEKREKNSLMVAEPIKHFWSTVLLSSAAVAEICSEEDLEVLKSLLKVESEFDRDSLNFKVRFEFEENDFFTDRVLEKSFIFDGKSGDHPIRTEQSNIQWKKGKNVTKKIEKKKQRNKKTGQSRVIEREVPAPSFFQFFADKIELESEDEGQEQDILEDKLRCDYEVGQALVEEVLPGALDYYLGIHRDEVSKAIEGLSDEDGDEDEDDEDEDDE